MVVKNPYRINDAKFNPTPVRPEGRKANFWSNFDKRLYMKRLWQDCKVAMWRCEHTEYPALESPGVKAHLIHACRLEALEKYYEEMGYTLSLIKPKPLNTTSAIDKIGEK